jgi:hypothetical protein
MVIVQTYDLRKKQDFYLIIEVFIYLRKDECQSQISIKRG